MRRNGYQIIPDDQFRSYLRAPVATGVRRRLEFVDGRFELREVTPGRPAAPATPELLERERQLNRDLLLAMRDQCERYHVPFAIVLLQDFGYYQPDLIHSLGANRIPIVDLTRLQYERFAHDYHPNAADHRRIAEAIASSAIGDLVGH